MISWSNSFTREASARPSLLMAMFAILLLGKMPLTAEEPISLPQSLPPVAHPDDNPPSEAKTALGRQLFFDPRLSRTNKIACATCHDPEKGFSNGRRFGVGVDGRKGTRNVPTLVNVVYNRIHFWDGRAASLEEQALAPIQNPKEMDMPLDKLVAKLRGIDEYRKQFENVFGTEVSSERIAKAIAAYERTIVSHETPLDRYLTGDKNALSPAALRGMKLFFGDARCSVCHQGPNLTDGAFHNVGAIDPKLPDAGRRAVTNREEDEGAFKTPTLRGVAHTAPYMHNGRFNTLEEVVRHYNFGGVTDEENPHRDTRLAVLYLSEEQTADLVKFLVEGLK